MPDATVSAQNVQCIHTSLPQGTPYRNCDQDWDMGICGVYQIAAEPFPKGSHGLCPYMYISAFNNTFPAIRRPLLCLLTGGDDCQNYPENFKMGYMETRKEEVSGTLYAKTTLKYPYN